jgi:diguanylate cyclase (GGDEF)-like protein/putative nucleotidyltransferase with HDIG domain
MSPFPNRLAGTTDRFPALRRPTDDPATAVEALIEEGQLAERQGRREVARSLYERALYALRDRSQAVTAAALLRWVGLTYQLDADFDAAFDCFEAALAVSDACGDEAGVGHAMNVKAIAHFRLGQLDEAEQLYLQARDRARRSGEAKLAAMTAQNLGVIANIRGDLEQALGHYEASLADYRALGLTKYICTTLNNLGVLYTRMERWETAERAYDEAVEISQVLGDLPTRILLEVNRASHWIARRDYGRGREACDLAMSLSQQTQDTHALGEAHKCYGVIARETGDYAGAEQSFQRAADLAAQRQDLLLAAETAREMAELYRLQGRNRDTLQCLNRAHRLFSQLHARRDVADIDRQTQDLEEDFLQMVQRWGDSIESKDHYTQGHCERVADLACALAEAVGIDQKSLFWFRIGALLHDVGKLTIPPEVLNKPGRLTAEEWALVKHHPVAGVQMLADIEFPWDVRPIVESHHERWDGAGYPYGLAGEAIPLTARILCIADVYDALTSERSYKKPVSHEQALEMMRSEVGAQFDPELFAHFERIVSRVAPRRERAAAQRAAADTEAASADLDHLTGVPLRRGFMSQANAILARLRPSEVPPSLLVIDVDHFKLVNDTYGHLQGDDVLRAVVSVFRRVLRAGDVIGRYGGDEFVVLLPRTPIDNARDVAERLRLAVEEERCTVRDMEGATIGVTLSIGVAAADAGAHIEGLFAAADRALYDAKRAGRNAVAVAGAAAESARPHLSLNRFVGRVQETRKLVRLLESSVNGQPQVVAVVGEAGVGKSTLLRQLLPEVRLRNGALVLGRCLEADVKPPYGPWAEALGAVAGRVSQAGREWRELPRLVPSLGDPQRPPPPDLSGNKYALYNEIAEYLRLAAAACPLVIVLDDMQWADSATWDTLEHLLPQLQHDRILVALTIRAEDVTSDAQTRRRRLSRDERFHELQLPRLSREELEQWLAAASQGQELGERLLPVLYRHTEGNPFLVLQVLRSLIDEGDIRYVDGRWTWRETSELRLPVAVSDLMARRLDRLSPKTRGILTTAAIIGRVFDVDLAVAAGAGSENDLLEAVDEAIGAAVLDAARNDSSRFTFAHALLVDAIRSTANPRRLKRIHQSVARAMEEHAADAVAEIAAHYDQAGDSERAYAWAMRAGERATTVYALDEAIAFFSMALRHGTPGEAQIDAALALARVAEPAGRYAEGQAVCDAALEDVEAASPPPAALRPLRRMRERLRAHQGEAAPQILSACYQLLAEAEAAGDERERVALLTFISEVQSRLADWPEAERLAGECIQMAERMDDARLLADALVRHGGTLLRLGRLAEAVQRYQRASDIFTGIGDRYKIARCEMNIGIGHSMAGDVAAAELAYRRAIDLARDAHAPDLDGLASLNLGVLCSRGGRYEEARQAYEDALRLFTMVRNEAHRLASLYNMADLARDQGDSERALALYEESAQLARHVGQIDVEIGARAGAGLSALQLSRCDVATDAARAVNELLAGPGGWWFQGRELAEALCILEALHRGAVDEADARFRKALEAAEQHEPYGAAWLVVEVAPALSEAGVRETSELVSYYGARVKELGYAALERRYARLAEQRSGGKAADG